MICYKDRTFCVQSFKPRTCCNLKCYRYLTQKERKHARTVSLGIASADFKPTCGQHLPITPRKY